MKKLLIIALAVGVALPAMAAQQEITAISTITANREALRTALNLRLAAVESNFDEIYAKVNAGPVYVNASAPADTSVVWIDTDQDNAIKVYITDTWTVVGTAGGAYSLPTAAADTLGGVKVGSRLTITDGVLSADVQSGDDLGSATYSDVVGLWTTCTGYLKSDGTCDTPSGSATYPSAAGVANWNGSAWGTSYTVGTAASNLVKLNGSAQLPAVSGALLTGTFTGALLSAQTTISGAIQTIGTELDGQDELLFDSDDFSENTSTPGQVTVSLALNASGFDGNLATTDDTIQEIAQKFDDLTVPSAGIGGSTGSTDNAIIRANGIGGSTAQASGVTIDDNDNLSTTGTLSGKMATVVNSDTASYSVTTTQARSGTIFLTTNAATTTYTLPAAEAGMSVCFRMGQGNSQILRIDTDGMDYIVKSTGARTSAAGDYYGATASATNKVCVAAYDATDWYVESEGGTWAEE